MSDTTFVGVHLDGEQNDLKNWRFESLTADPTGADLYAGRLWRDATTARPKTYDGTAVQTVAYLSDLEQFSAWNGTHDASTGIPTTGSAESGAIRAGDRWLIGTAGTIVGITADSDQLSPGDILVANVDGAATASDFVGIQSNVDLTGAVVAEQYTIAVPAGAATAIGTGLSTIHSVETLVNNEPYRMSVDLAAKTVMNNVAKAAVDVRVIGVL